MAIKDIQNIDKKSSSFDFNKSPNKSSSTLSTDVYKILIISESSSDIFLINKFLSKNSGFRVDEAVNLSSAFKIINHLSLDLIIVDDMLSKMDGYDVVDRLNIEEASKNIPKILLLSENYNVKKRDNFKGINVDFIQKPLSITDFKHRVKSIIKLSYNANGYFQNMADIKYFESKDYISVYKNFFDLDSNILFVYDKNNHRVIDANRSFNSAFLSIYHFNRVISSEKLFKKFIPYMEEDNYLNHYDPSSWLKMITFSDKSSFMLQVNMSGQLYNFMLEFNNISIFNENIFICKFINLDTISPFELYNRSNILVQKDELQNLQKSLELIKEQVGYLSGGFMSENLYNELDRLKLRVNSLVNGEKNSSRDSKIEFDSVNVYELIGKVLQEKYSMKKVSLNGIDIHEISNFDKKSIYIDIDSSLLKDLVSGILSSYFGGDFDESSNNGFLRVEVYEDQNSLLIDIREPKIVQSKNFFIDKFFKKDDNNNEFIDFSNEILPKSVEYAISKLSVKLKKALISNENIFLISIPLKTTKKL